MWYLTFGNHVSASQPSSGMIWDSGQYLISYLKKAEKPKCAVSHFIPEEGWEAETLCLPTVQYLISHLKKAEKPNCCICHIILLPTLDYTIIVELDSDISRQLLHFHQPNKWPWTVSEGSHTYIVHVTTLSVSKIVTSIMHATYIQRE